MNEGRDLLEAFAILNDERAELENRWSEGYYESRLPELEEFIRNNKEQIRSALPAKTTDQILLQTIQKLILEKKTLNHRREMQDQAQEIRNEIWYRGEKGENDKVSILSDWTSQYAPQWRTWRLKEYLFMAEKCGLEIYRSL